MYLATRRTPKTRSTAASAALHVDALASLLRNVTTPTDGRPDDLMGKSKLWLNLISHRCLAGFRHA
jgi:hypothetical protein